MKYLHSGYILFCKNADHAENGAVDAYGLFDLFTSSVLPIRMNCSIVIGFGTPYERRQYEGVFVLNDPDGAEVFRKEFSANDPDDLWRGHYIFHPDLSLEREGLWTAGVSLSNQKGESLGSRAGTPGYLPDEEIWSIERKFWAMLETDTPPDP